MEDFNNPTIFIGDIRIDEPVTTGTDLIVAAIGIFAFFKLGGKDQLKHVLWFRWFFLVTALSTLVSSLIGHAFNYHFGLEARIYGWMLGVASASLAQFAASYHAASYISDKSFRALLIFNCIETLAAFILTLIIRKFIVVEIHSAIALLFVLLPFEIRIWSKTRSKLSRHMITGVVLCVCAVTCHITKLIISRWFNHLDISHVFMALAMWIMYTGVKTEHK